METNVAVMCTEDWAWLRMVRRRAQETSRKDPEGAGTDQGPEL